MDYGMDGGLDQETKTGASRKGGVEEDDERTN